MKRHKYTKAERKSYKASRRRELRRQKLRDEMTRDRETHARKLGESRVSFTLAAGTQCHHQAAPGADWVEITLTAPMRFYHRRIVDGWVIYRFNGAGYCVKGGAKPM